MGRYALWPSRRWRGDKPFSKNRSPAAGLRGHSLDSVNSYGVMNTLPATGEAKAIASQRRLSSTGRGSRNGVARSGRINELRHETSQTCEANESHGAPRRKYPK